MTVTCNTPALISWVPEEVTAATMFCWIAMSFMPAGKAMPFAFGVAEYQRGAVDNRLVAVVAATKRLVVPVVPRDRLAAPVPPSTPRLVMTKASQETTCIPAVTVNMVQLPMAPKPAAPVKVNDLQL